MKSHWNVLIIPGTLVVYQYTYMIIYLSFLLRIKNVSDKICRDNQNTHFKSNNFSPEKSCRYETMWKKNVKPDRTQIKIWRMRIASWLPKATNTNSEYVILIGFQRQRWLHELASMLRCTYTACFVLSIFFFVLVNEAKGFSFGRFFLWTISRWEL